MEIDTTFLFKHELEIRLAVAALSIVGGYALVKIYTFIAEATRAAREALQKAAEAKSADIATSTAGAR